MKIFGAEIEWKANFTAVLAVTIASITAAVELYWALIGASTTLYAPEQIMINNDNLYRLRVFAPMTYVNSGRAFYNDTIMQESVYIRIEGHERETVQRWQHFVGFDPLDEENFVNVRQSAIPTLVGGRSTESHETWFAPRSDDCPTEAPCVKTHNRFIWADFVAAVETATRIDFRFTARLAGERLLEVACYVIVDDVFRNQISQHGWAAPPCFQDSPVATESE